MISHISFPRYIVLTGNYGSGKTELSLNLASQLAAGGKSVTLVDLDIVNPYFRSAEKASDLEKEGVRVLMPVFAMSTVDIPALPAEIQSVFTTERDHVIFDVGGDDTGAAALGQYYPYFQKYREQTLCMLVINGMRPFTSSVEDVLDLAKRISLRGRLSPDALVNNTNLADRTEPDMVEAGERLTLSCAEKLNISKVYSSGEERILSSCRLHSPQIRLTRRMIPEWMQE